MKKISVLFLAVGLLSTVSLGAYTTDEIKPAAPAMTVGQTANWSDLGWKLSTAGTTGILPWAGTKEITGAGDMRKVEVTIQQYGVVVNSDAGCNLGDGTVVGLNGTTPILNSLLKLNVKTGTFNLSGQTMWADKVQNGTQTRTAYNTDYPCITANSVMNIGTDGALRVTGTQAVANTGNIQIGYAASNDSWVKVYSNGILSSVKRDGDTVLGAVNMDLGRNAASQYTEFEINGSDALVEIGSLRLDQNSTNTTMLKFVTDADGVSPINVYGNGANAVIFGNMSKLDFVLGAAPEMDQVFTLLNLVYDGSTQRADDNTGAKFRDAAGNSITQYNCIVRSFGGTDYFLKISYIGGTGNDVTLTVVPEPATLAILSLGGLALVRRRRA